MHEQPYSIVGFDPYVDNQHPETYGVLDSKCQAPFGASSAAGAMLLMLVPVEGAAGDSGSRKGMSCDAECLKMAGFTARFNVQECIGKAAECPATTGCNTTMTWKEFNALQRRGRGYTGGLARNTIKRRNRDYGVWTCMRDWDEDEQLKCGAQMGELACFWFEERSRQFEFQGLNSETRNVSPEQVMQGHMLEDKHLRGRTLATAPDQDHV